MENLRPFHFSFVSSLGERRKASRKSNFGFLTNFNTVKQVRFEVVKLIINGSSCNAWFQWFKIFLTSSFHCFQMLEILIPLVRAHTFGRGTYLWSRPGTSLDAPSHLYMRSCPSVGRSVRPSVRRGRVIFKR